LKSQETDLKNEGFLGFPQAQAEVVCNQKDLRLSVWNDDQYLVLQSVLWKDDSDSLGKTRDGRSIGDYSIVSFDLDLDQMDTPKVDRLYLVNPWPYLLGLGYQIVMSEKSTSGIQTDSKGRGSIIYVPTSDGKQIRVDTYAILLDEIGKKIGDRIRFAYMAFSPHPEFRMNSIRFKSDNFYHISSLPKKMYHEILLTYRIDGFEPKKLPDGRLN
jgi:hypothetical protein